MGVLHAEWTKIRTVRSTGWLAAATALGTVAVGAAVSAAQNPRDCTAPCAPDMVKLSLSGIQLGQIAVVVLAVMIVANEYAAGTIAATLTATPQRPRVVLAKHAVGFALAVAAGAAGVAGALLAAAYIWPARGWAAHVALGRATWAAAAGSVAYLGLVAVLAAGVALVVRDTAVALTAVLALLYGVPLVAALVGDPRWQHRLHRYGPMEAGLALQTTVGRAAIGGWAGLGVLAAYAAVAALAGAAAFQWRDA